MSDPTASIVWAVWSGGFYEPPGLEDIFATEELAQEFLSTLPEWRGQAWVKPHEVRTSLDDEWDEEDEDDE